MTSDVIRVWSRILQSVPNSRLLIKSTALEDGTTKEGVLHAFSQHGITADRLDLKNSVPRRRAHLKLYSSIDIALDPFPYNGTTTTFEAMWMGVPVITLRGNRHAGRVGASILHHVGLPELIAENEDDYVDLAQQLAGDAGRMTALRGAMRPRLQKSSLMNASLFTETLENAYRQMWTTWCSKSR